MAYVLEALVPGRCEATTGLKPRVSKMPEAARTFGLQHFPGVLSGFGVLQDEGLVSGLHVYKAKFNV